MNQQKYYVSTVWLNLLLNTKSQVATQETKKLSSYFQNEVLPAETLKK